MAKVGLYIVVGLFIGVSFYAISQPSRQEPFTEFYFSNPNRLTLGSFSVDPENPTSISFVINNHEGADISYEVQVIVVTAEGMYIKMADQSFHIKSGTLYEEKLLLRTQFFNVRVIKLILYKLGQSTPYRTLELIIGNKK